ncbi:MAG TPA: hypothetical protein VKE70_29030 [Candidatus Solibacter sp.]|nr:hypothetical protein [Candidatus Solibacter sp.]
MPLRIAYAVGGLVAAFAIGYAVYQEYLPVTQGGYVTVLILLAGVVSHRFLDSMKSEGMSIESHWGGIGGGLGGWKVSNSLSYFAMTIALLAMVGTILPASHALDKTADRDRFASLIERYHEALQAARNNGIDPHVGMASNKLMITGQSPNQAATNAVWDAIKKSSPGFYGDIQVSLTLAKPPAEAAKK